jgi:hypothetical protein
LSSNGDEDDSVLVPVGAVAPELGFLGIATEAEVEVDGGGSGARVYPAAAGFAPVGPEAPALALPGAAPATLRKSRFSDFDFDRLDAEDAGANERGTSSRILNEFWPGNMVREC